MKIKINLDNMINPHFDYVLYSNALNKVLKGGRGSTKSSVISLRIVIDFLQDSNANALILRKVANTLELSVYEQIKWPFINYMLIVNLSLLSRHIELCISRRGQPFILVV